MHPIFVQIITTSPTHIHFLFLHIIFTILNNYTIEELSLLFKNKCAECKNNMQE